MNSIKDHYLYSLFVEYLEKSKLSKGAIELSKISEESFFSFKFKYDTSEKFKNDRDRFHKTINRENKINDIIND